MLVFWKERFVLLSVPKTGTQAYVHALAPRASMVITDPPELKHAPLYRYNRFFRPMFEKLGAESMDVVAVIREPIDWLGSWFRYRQRDALNGKPTSTRGVSFEEFVLASCEDAPPAFANVGSQARFTEPRPNGTSVSHFFQYENQKAFRSFLESRLGDLPPVPDMNVSPKLSLSLSQHAQKEVKEKRRADFELWHSIR